MDGDPLTDDDRGRESTSRKGGERRTEPDRRADDDVQRFLVRGRLERLPRRRADRDRVVAWLATRVLAHEDPVDERTLTDRLADVVADPVGLRRELVDSGLVTRARDGSSYWRTRVTEFDGL